LAGVTGAWPNQPSFQYTVFLCLCMLSFVIFIIHAISFRLVYRKKKNITAALPSAGRDLEAASGSGTGHEIITLDRQTSSGNNLYRIVHDDGRVEFRENVDNRLVHDENVVIADLALSGGRNASDGSKKWDWNEFGRRCWQCIEMLWNPLFFPLIGPIFMTGGVSQGWWNASWNLVVNHAGNQWNGWIYAIAESMGMVSAVIIGLFFDRLRKKYEPHKYRW
jgi:hypothetical protein